MFKKISEGFGFGLGFSLAALIVSGIAWSGYIQPQVMKHNAELTTQMEHSSAQRADTPTVLTKSDLQQKECSLLILLYGDTQDTEIANSIKNFVVNKNHRLTQQKPDVGLLL